MAEYRAEAQSLTGMVQQTVAYIRSGYFLYVMGCVPEGKDPAAVDAKLIEKYGIARSKWQRSRRKADGLANLQYIRFGSTWLLMATKGRHDLFFEREETSQKMPGSYFILAIRFLDLLRSALMAGVEDTSYSTDITRMLGEIAEGRASARGELITAVYHQLRKIAQVRMAGERPDHTLQATALVHEAYLRLSDDLGGRVIKNRQDFYGAAAEAMRRILIDHARKHGAEKRGRLVRVPLANVADLADTGSPDMILAVDEAFEILKSEQPAFAEVVRLRFFAGLNVEETAAVMGISTPTVKRRWKLARAMLHEILERGNIMPGDCPETTPPTRNPTPTRNLNPE